MGDAIIAYLNKFRQLVKSIAINYPSKIVPYRVISSIYLAELRLLENSKDIIIIFGTDMKSLYYKDPINYNLKAEDTIGRTPLNIFNTGAEVGV
ncbi:MAG: hypothetical protein ACE14P_11455 [Methanotrichaceae archaeon]